ncbi:transporter substrate-binding domain-containing protein [Candidatus Puniceispirillum sp.]|uniref:transporter substrate-binding domain-containing protein n=1 Tax=Candidatus Puniceispirillum sp. TaxID=2026719 RepID=UPI003F695EEA
MNNSLQKALAPTGVLRVAINLGNSLLVTGQEDDGTPIGISPDIAKHVASILDVPCRFVLFDRPGQLADAVDQGLWDIGNIADEVERSKTIDFSNPYVLIDTHFLVRDDSEFQTNRDVDTLGATIAVSERSAYELWLRENFKKARIVSADSIAQSHEYFRQGKAVILAGLLPKLEEELSFRPGYRIIKPPFTAIKQAMGVRKNNPELVEFLNNVVATLIKNGFIHASLEKHNVLSKLTIPPPRSINS